ncbi:MAG: hypothetical protein HQK92_00180 [Nitrospirae bacterium]|nr:hypothetical protein [Nitrospirota bacterium]
MRNKKIFIILSSIVACLSIMEYIAGLISFERYNCPLDRVNWDSENPTVKDKEAVACFMKLLSIESNALWAKAQVDFIVKNNIITGT